MEGHRQGAVTSVLQEAGHRSRGLGQARRLRLAVRPPHINNAGRNFAVRTVDGQKILFMGQDQVKDLTGRAIDRIQQKRPVTSLEDFLACADPRPQEAESLAKVGALEGLATIPTILSRLQGEKWQAGQMSLFGWNEPQGEEWSLEQKVAAQQEILGVSLAAHPLELVIDKISAARAISTLDAIGRLGQRVTVAGVRQTSHRSCTAKG